MKKDNDKFSKLQQEQRDLDASYRQSLKNKKEFDRIFGKKEEEELKESYEQSKRNKKERTDAV